jgi:NADH-ubiquinone oxidoreductase chain 5
MFVGWEGVGLCSYLLINFWFTRIQANKAAIKAMIMNRVGDFGLALGILGIYLNFHSIDYATVFSLAPYHWEQTTYFFGIQGNTLTIISLLLFIGAIGKSAQLGLHTWLPDAMEGPTPVSALIHAATMVTAGVFLLSRCSPLLEYAPLALAIISCVGGMTSFFAATTALVQNDMKRVIAYSTCSQLGYMVFACGLSSYGVGVFHLANHAFFKALLFLGAGSVIHGLADEQDMRKMGGLRRLLPFTYAMMLIGSLALIGFPYLTGFYSKDIILEAAYGKYDMYGDFAYILGCAAAFCTAFYSMRLLYLTFLAEPMGSKPVILGAHEPSINMSLTLGLLAIPSIFIGYLSKDLMIGWGGEFFGNALFCLPENYSLIDGEFASTLGKIFPVFLSLLGFFLSLYLYHFHSKTLYMWKTSYIGLYNFLNRKWFFDKVYNYYIGSWAVYMTYNFSYKVLDRGLFETMGPWGIKSLWQIVSTQTQGLQTGFVYHLALSVFLGCGFFLFLGISPLNGSVLILFACWLLLVE